MNRTAPSMAGILPGLAAMALAALLATGCGYGFAGKSDEPLGIAEDYRKMAITEVDNPTMETWLQPRVRSYLRDEFTRRGQVEWVPEKDAESLISIKILRFTRTALLKNYKDETLKYEAVIRLRATITSKADGSLLWDSGVIEEGESYFTDQARTQENLVVELAIRRLADRLAQAY